MPDLKKRLQSAEIPFQRDGDGDRRRDLWEAER